jgi:flagellar biosynthesis chaperone FliJ
MSVDMRRFSYRLDVVRSKSQWELDAQLREMRVLRQKLDTCDVELDQTHNARAETLGSMQRLLQLQVDPRTHASTLGFLVSLDVRIERMQTQRGEVSQALAQALNQCAALQTRLDQLDGHRQKNVAEFVSDESSRNQVALDSDWLLRASWLKRNEVGV